MSDLRDFTGKNRKFTGVIGERISTGTTGERDTGFGAGTLRFNTTTELMEYYDGNAWKSIDAPPSLSSITPNSFKSDGSTLFNISVTGGNFGIGIIAKWIGNDGTIYNSAVVTRTTISSITVQTVASMNVANEPYDLQVINVSSLSATLEDALDAGSSPAFTATAGTLGTLFNFGLAASNLTTQTFGPTADADSTVIQYSIISGSLPPGLSLGTGANNGKIVGTATSSATSSTSTFTIQASDGINTNSRQYTITRNGSVRQSFTAAGSFTFTVPTGMSSVNVLVVAGGGSGGPANDTVGSDAGGGGGAGGLVYVPAFPVTPGGTVSGNVGAGGAAPGGYGSGTPGIAGSDSTFGTLTAKGGGAGVTNNATAGQGGSGGSTGYGGTAGSATQPSQPGQSGTFGFGNNGGGPNPSDSPYSGAGGGGSGAAGTARSGGVAGAGGAGKTYSIADGSTPVFYAGGGGGGGGGPGPYNGAPGGSGGGGAGGNNNEPAGSARDGAVGTVNTGGGGGGGSGSPGNSTTAGKGGAGGRGIVIVEEA